jgi:S-adenosylmethionine:tRNA ribosyltransferase-isomerase
VIHSLSDYDYCLPQDLIAQKPSCRRSESRLLVLRRADGSVHHSIFRELPKFCQPGDLLVLNDTKVVAARLMGRRQTGGKVEVFLLERVHRQERGVDYFRAMIKPLGRLKTGEAIYFKKGFSCVLVDPKEKIVAFRGCRAEDVMEVAGQIPLPPYIRRKPTASDKERYQTVYARRAGAVAAPTAGLHFTKRLLGQLKKEGVRIAPLTLHVNFATFSPVHVEDVRDHKMAAEVYQIPASTVEAVRSAKRRGDRVVAVGTTAAKALEDAAHKILGPGPAQRVSCESRLFITPPYDFKIVDALITNFHLPRTTLIMLVAAFAGPRGRDFILRAYQEAILAGYRFYSYGDAMLVA